MFVRAKTTREYTYLQIVESRREGQQVRQRVLATLGRLDALQASGQLDDLARSLLKFSTNLAVIDAHRQGNAPAVSTRSIGPALVFERLWRQLGLDAVIKEQLSGTRYQFSLERAVFLTVLHRLFDSGSDRAADSWKDDYRIAGVKALSLHHLYRAMGWLGEPLVQLGADARTLRCRKDLLEEALFARNRDLFSDLDVVFFDTTSLYFEGEGGESLGQYGHSKDNRPDLKQMIVGLVLDGDGRPICCQMWPGNITDVTTLLAVVEQLKERFSIGAVCVVADRGMISAATIKELEGGSRSMSYILGVRMHRVKEVSRQVLESEEGFQPVSGAKKAAKDPSPLAVREQRVEGRRYIVCYNEEQGRKDAGDREAIVESLREKLKGGDKALVGNKGYRRYLKSGGSEHFTIDEQKIKEEQRFDGKWVLQTNTELSPEQVALKYKQLWMVESSFRSLKSILETRPIYHKVDETIRGHVFCSFLALVLLKELDARLEQRGASLEWADIKRDLRALQEVEVNSDGHSWYLRTDLRGVCHQVLQAAGVAVPPAVRK